MASITTIVSAISDALVPRLAARSMPPLQPFADGSPGAILLGRQRQAEQSAPPRVIFVPMGSEFGGPDVYVAHVKDDAGAYTTEAKAQLANRSLATEFLAFEVRVWGAAPAGTDPAAVRDVDFDATRDLYHQTILAIRDVLGPWSENGVELTSGKWTDATYAAAQAVALGREFVFGLKLGTPIVDVALTFAPQGVRPQATTNMVTETGASGQGCADS